MMFYVVTPTDTLVYDEVELSAVDASKRATWRVRVAAVQAWLDAHPGVQWSTLSGVALIAWNTVKNALMTAGKNAVLTHVVQRGGTAQSPKQIALATATYIAQWDGISPFVRTLFGTFPAAGIAFMGWPQTDVAPDPPTPLTSNPYLLDNPGAFDIVSAN
jgi:hypothetical protein